jgi:hypothetical protein
MLLSTVRGPATGRFRFEVKVKVEEEEEEGEERINSSMLTEGRRKGFPNY